MLYHCYHVLDCGTIFVTGYGDITPDTLYGKLVGAACALSGVLMMALPVSVVASNFSLYNNYAKVRIKVLKLHNIFPNSLVS
jgi:potassium voltage-gated channel Shaw-related subfamily C protein 1